MNHPAYQQNILAERLLIILRQINASIREYHNSESGGLVALRAPPAERVSVRAGLYNLREFFVLGFKEQPPDLQTGGEDE